MRLIPLQSLCFQDPLLLLICTTVPSKANEVYRLTVERDETLEELLANFLKAQSSIKVQAKNHRMKDQFLELGFSKFSILQTHATSQAANEKSSPRLCIISYFQKFQPSCLLAMLIGEPNTSSVSCFPVEAGNFFAHMLACIIPLQVQPTQVLNVRHWSL